MKYRIIDEVDTIHKTNRIIIEKTNFLDRILSFGGPWCYVASIFYDDNPDSYLHKDKDTAIADAKKMIDEIKNGECGIKKTLIAEVI